MLNLAITAYVLGSEIAGSDLRLFLSSGYTGYFLNFYQLYVQVPLKQTSLFSRVPSFFSKNLHLRAWINLFVFFLIATAILFGLPLYQLLTLT